MSEDKYGRVWIKHYALEVLETYNCQITLRQLYYRLVAKGMINDLNHYKRVVAAMGDSRWNGSVDFGAFIDRERAMVGETAIDEKDLEAEVERAKDQIKAWMTSYHLNKWSNQPKYVEVWIEKKALQGVFERPCYRHGVALAPCKGYPSLTFLHEARERFDAARSNDKEVILLYFGDYDPSGEDIPRSIKENLSRMGADVEVIRMALTPEQIAEYELPSVPTKVTDSRSRSWSGDGVVELDAVEPNTLADLCDSAIREHFENSLEEELEEREADERERYVSALKAYIEGLGA